MSGIYPDVPGNRMAYHRDGSVGFTHTGATVTVLTSGQLQELNDEDSVYLGGPMHNDSYGGGFYVGVVFPELRDLSGWFIEAPSQYYPGSIESSPDSTSGLDGTWVVHSTPDASKFSIGTVPAYRLSIQPLSLSGRKAFRMHTGSSGGGATVDIATLHLYGKPSVGQVRYLLFTDTGGTEVTGAYFDYGDDPRGGPSETKAFKIKNGNGTLAASNIVLSCSTLTDKTPSFADDYTFSSDNVTFTPTINIGTLANGASSATLYVKRTTPIGAQLSIECPLFSAVAASWS